MFKGVENEVNAILSEKSEFSNQKFAIFKFFKTYKNLFLNNYFHFHSVKKKNNIRFLINKRGRRRKSLITNNEINKDEITNLGKKVHNKYCNDNIKRRLKACYHKYIISFLNNLMKTVLKQTRIRFVKMNSINVSKSDTIYRCENVYRCTDCSDSKNIIYCDSCGESEFLIASQRSGNCNFCIRCDDSKNCSNSYNVICSNKVNNSLFIQDCFDLYECMFCSHIASKRYCIANMQFEEQEYFAIKKVIIDWILNSK